MVLRRGRGTGHHDPHGARVRGPSSPLAHGAPRRRRGWRPPRRGPRTASVTPFAFDAAQDLLAVDLAHHDVAPAHGGHRVGHAPAVAVEHGQGVQQRVAVAHGGVPAEDRGVEPAVPVGELHPLRAGRGARGVVDRAGGGLRRPPSGAGWASGGAGANSSASSFAVEDDPHLGRHAGQGRRRSRGRRAAPTRRSARRCSATSSALSRKLTGTRTRPNPLTPKYEMRKRAEFGLTMATRSPGATPMASRASAMPRARSCISA